MTIRNTTLGGTNWQDTGQSSLVTTITSAATSMVVASTGLFKSSGTVLIGTELINYGSKTSSLLTSLTRGAYASTAASHTAGASIYEKEILTSTDLNSTFNAAASLVLGLTTFFFNTSLYDEYDNFDTETTGNFATNAKWTVTVTSADHCNIVESTNAGGATKELRLWCDQGATGTNTETLSTVNLSVGKHTFCRVYCSADGASSNTISGLAKVRFANTGSYYNFFTWGTSGTHSSDTCISLIMVICTASGEYDLYAGGKKLASYSGVSDANAKILDFQVSSTVSGALITTAKTYLYIDDVRQSK